MQENLYQNIDISQNNPLNTEGTSNITPAPKASKKLNPKIITLIVLGSIIVLLFITSLIVTSLRQKTPTPKTPQITPIPTNLPSPPLQVLLSQRFIRKNLESSKTISKTI